MPTYLNVTYHDKDRAKALGAKWDNGARRWYAPDGTDLSPLSEWIPTSMFIVVGKRKCFRCERETFLPR